MKKLTEIIAHTVKKQAESALKSSANSTTCTSIYQPKAPEALKQFSKLKNDR